MYARHLGSATGFPREYPRREEIRKLLDGWILDIGERGASLASLFFFTVSDQILWGYRFRYTRILNDPVAHDWLDHTFLSYK